MIPALASTILGCIPLLLMMFLVVIKMTAQANHRDPKHQDGTVKSMTIATGVTGYAGAAYVIDGGYLKPFTTALALKPFAGIAVNGGAAGDADNVDRSGIGEFVGSGLAETDIGREVWLTDDQTVTTTPQCYPPHGMIVDVPSATAPLIDITGYTNRPAGIYHLEYPFGNLNTVSTTVVTVPIGAIVYSEDLEVLVHMSGATVDAGDADDANGFLAATTAAAVGWTALAGSDATTLGAYALGADQTGSTVRLNHGYAAETALKVTTSNHADLSCVLHIAIYLPGGNA